MEDHQNRNNLQYIIIIIKIMSWLDRTIKIPYPYTQPNSIASSTIHNHNNNNNNNSTLYSESRVTEKWQAINHTNYLLKYRTNKVDQIYKVGIKESKKYLPDILCNFFGIGSVDSGNAKTNSNCELVCQCNKTEDKLCELVMRWVEQEYYWKTDKQFHKIYDNYLSKRTQQPDHSTIRNKLMSICAILGIQMENQQISVVMEILTNYVKHAEYYNKMGKLVACGDVYVWVCLGVCYHLGFEVLVSSKLHRTIGFWGLDIAMDSLGDLQGGIVNRVQDKAYRNFEFYFSKWVHLLNSRSINLRQLIGEWIRELMFGYMGIEHIAFFIDCFRKSSWNYLIKLMLSYFQTRTKQICKNQNFLIGNIDQEELIRLIVNSREEWPMIFCNASSFSIKE